MYIHTFALLTMVLIDEGGRQHVKLFMILLVELCCWWDRLQQPLYDPHRGDSSQGKKKNLKIDVVTGPKVIIVNLHLCRLHLKFKQSTTCTQDPFAVSK